MSTMPHLTDNEAQRRIQAALDALGDEAGESIRGNAVLEAARRTLTILSLSMVAANEGELGKPRLPGTEH